MACFAPVCHIVLDLGLGPSGPVHERERERERERARERERERERETERERERENPAQTGALIHIV